MTKSIADTNILIEIYRNNPISKLWFSTQQDIAIPSITWLELMEGSRGKAGERKNLQIIAQFGMEFLTIADQQWAMNQLLRFRLSHGVSFKDFLIASVCNRLQVPLFTKNVKDFLPMLNKQLVISPY